VKDGAPNLINFDLRDGVYIAPKVIDKGYLVIGKRRLDFERN
jgi:type IV secretion system protein VirB9